jgi:hypothetical protein
MSTSTPTPDRTARTPTLTDGTWRAETETETETASDAPTRSATFQFRPGCDLRLYNLIDDENRAML